VLSNRTTRSAIIGLLNDSADNSKRVCGVSGWCVDMIFDGFIVEDGNAETSSGGPGRLGFARRPCLVPLVEL
jgi:hypothetical protein